MQSDFYNVCTKAALPRKLIGGGGGFYMESK